MKREHARDVWGCARKEMGRKRASKRKETEREEEAERCEGRGMGNSWGAKRGEGDDQEGWRMAVGEIDRQKVR